VMAYEMSLDVQRAAQLSDDLRESEARLRDITSAWPIGCGVTKRGLYIQFGAGFGAVWSRCRKTPFDLMPPDEAKRVARYLRDRGKETAPQGPGDSGMWERMDTGSASLPVVYRSWTRRAISRAIGREQGITERKLAEEALKKSEAALRYSQKDLQRLAGR